MFIQFFYNALCHILHIHSCSYSGKRHVIGNLRKKSLRLLISVIISLQFCPMLFVCSSNKKLSLKIFFFSSFQKQNIALLKKVESRSKKLKVINLSDYAILTTKFMLSSTRNISDYTLLPDQSSVAIFNDVCDVREGGTSV